MPEIRKCNSPQISASDRRVMRRLIAANFSPDVEVRFVRLGAWRKLAIDYIEWLVENLEKPHANDLQQLLEHFRRHDDSPMLRELGTLLAIHLHALKPPAHHGPGQSPGQKQLKKLLTAIRQRDVAVRVGSERSTVAKWASGLKRPSPRARVELEKAYGIPFTAWPSSISKRWDNRRM